MEKLEIALYGAAIYLAIKSLVSLMADHGRTMKQRLTEELAAAQRAATEAAAQHAAPTPAKSGRPLKKAG
ncbi:MAG TPA: hypothetical protein VG055_14720 [Planctomycetaceae bacterium]|jgi:hypothetical protein|nr:hypothetical protein [Planctomycetaceae bacterium]